MLAQVNTCTQTHTNADACHFATPVEHGCQVEKEREMYSFTFYCARIEC